MPRPAPCLFPAFRAADADAMIRWLKDTLGFAERAVYRDDAGRVVHAELILGSSILMLGQARDDDTGALIGTGRSGTLYLAVEDADAIFARVEGSGAGIETPLHDTDYGSRDFAFRDPEGNLWSVGTYWPDAETPPLAG